MGWTPPPGFKVISGGAAPSFDLPPGFKVIGGPSTEPPNTWAQDLGPFNKGGGLMDFISGLWKNTGQPIVEAAPSMLPKIADPLAMATEVYPSMYESLVEGTTGEFGQALETEGLQSLEHVLAGLFSPVGGIQAREAGEKIATTGQTASGLGEAAGLLAGMLPLGRAGGAGRAARAKVPPPPEIEALLAKGVGAAPGIPPARSAPQPITPAVPPSIGTLPPPPKPGRPAFRPLGTAVDEEGLSGITTLPDGTKAYWTEGRSSPVVYVKPDGRRLVDAYYHEPDPEIFELREALRKIDEEGYPGMSPWTPAEQQEWTSAMDTQVERAQAGRKLSKVIKGEPAGVEDTLTPGVKGVQEIMDRILKEQPTTEHLKSIGVGRGAAPTAPKPPAIQALEGKGFKLPRAEAPAPLAALNKAGIETLPPPRHLKIERNPTLSPASKVVEEKVAQLWEANPQALVDRYFTKKGFKNGGYIIGADEAKDLFPEYAATPQTRQAHSVAVHQTGRAVASAAFDQMIAKPVTVGHEPVVVFTAGGPGSGKTTNLYSTLEKVAGKAHGVVDTTAQDLVSTSGRIEATLKAGKEVAIVFTIRTPEDGVLNGVIPRALAEGRALPIDEALRGYARSAETFEGLVRKYEGNSKVHLYKIDNRLGPGKAQLTDVPLDQSWFQVDDAARKRIYAKVDELRAAGTISDDLYQTLRPGQVEGQVPKAGPVVGGRAKPAGAGAPKAPKPVKPGVGMEEGLVKARERVGKTVPGTAYISGPPKPRTPPPPTKPPEVPPRPRRALPPVPLTRSERTGGKVARVAESAVESSIGGAPPFKAFREKQQKYLKAHAGRAVSDIGKPSIGPDALYDILRGQDLEAVKGVAMLGKSGDQATKIAVKSAKARLLADVFERSTRGAKTIVPLPYKFGGSQVTGTREVIQGQALRKQLYTKHGEVKLREVYSPQELESINRVLDTAERVGHTGTSMLATLANYYSVSGAIYGLVGGKPAALAGPAALNLSANVTARLMTGSWSSKVMSEFLKAAGRTGKYAATDTRAAFWAARLAEQAKRAAEEERSIKK